MKLSKKKDQLEEQHCSNCNHQQIGICWCKDSFYGEETKLDDWCWCWKKLSRK